MTPGEKHRTPPVSEPPADTPALFRLAASTPAGSSGYDADAITLADPGALIIAGSSVDLAEVVFDAARDGDQQQPDGRARSPEPVRAATGQEHEAARRGVERLAPAADRQRAVQHIKALIVPVMHMQRRPGADAGLKDAQSAARRLPRPLQAGIARQAVRLAVITVMR
jgi:hypothetical protein